MPFRAPVDDFRFILSHVAPMAKLVQTEAFAEATPDMTDAVLGEMGKLMEEVMEPTRRNGDIEGAVLENGVVRTSPGFKDAFQKLAEGGWIGI